MKMKNFFDIESVKLHVYREMILPENHQPCSGGGACVIPRP